MKNRSHFWSVAITVASLLMVDIALRTAGAGKVPAPPKVITAQEFRLVDESGKVRGKISVAKDKPGIALYNKDSTSPRVVLAINSSNDPVLVFLDKDGSTPRLSFGLAEKQDGGGVLKVYDKEGKTTDMFPK